MRTIQFVPGAIATPNPVTIPVTEPNIEAVVSAEITRLPSSLSPHAAGLAAVAHADGAAPVAHAGAAVKDHVFTQPGDHTLTPDVAKGGAVTNALGEDGAGNLETAAGAAVGMGTCIDAHAGGAVDAHTVTQPNDHLQAAIVAALADHPAADIAAALADHTGTDPVVAAVPTRLTTRTISLDVNTVLGDMLTLNYYEVGERVSVS